VKKQKIVSLEEKDLTTELDQIINFLKPLLTDKFNHNNATCNALVFHGKTSYFKSHAADFMELKFKPAITEALDPIKINFFDYDNLDSNPKYEKLCQILTNYSKLENIDLIISIGGGSIIDYAKGFQVARGINYKNFHELKIKLRNNDILSEKSLPLHMAIPTTFGSGSESTSFSVLYIDDMKYSLSASYLLPDIVFLDHRYAEYMSLEVKTSTVLDAFSQAIESLWSVNATNGSRVFAEDAIEKILPNIMNYLFSDVKNFKINQSIAIGSNLAGQSINITKTTLPHALSYYLTINYNLSHGHAVALTLGCAYSKLLQLEKKLSYEDIIGVKIIKNVLSKSGITDLQEFIMDVLEKAGLYKSLNAIPGFTSKSITLMEKSVNIQRMKNFPLIDEISISELIIDCL
jgi:alcohol dehydrogenase